MNQEQQFMSGESDVQEGRAVGCVPCVELCFERRFDDAWSNALLSQVL